VDDEAALELVQDLVGYAPTLYEVHEASVELTAPAGGRTSGEVERGRKP
jgi:hypothetical protein